ncbi:MAG TPA: GDSL-type esterase/lipase family protein, partial [Phycisphaerae bacterium]|nr:GDSL-type esterase/lipase family protein [Phycisphaerae bacterium]
MGAAWALGLLLAALPPAVQAVERIMPLGDSITYGWSSTNTDGYRRQLYLDLVAAGYSVDFVGSLADGPGDFDRDHEGHSGWRADQIRDNITTWLTNTPADIVLLHIGTNDISGGESAAGITAEVEQILDNIDAYEASHDVLITVILARIVNRSNPFDARGLETTAYNEALQALADARIAAGDRIIVVDQEPALTYPADMADAVHPNDGGYLKMAAVWFDALDALLSGGWVTNLSLSEAPLRQASGELVCAYTLVGPATTTATGWYRNAAPWMLLYLPMEGGDGNALVDHSGNNLVVTKVGAPTWSATAGHDGRGAFVFDGDESLYAGEHFPPSASYTKAAWVYRTGSGSNGGNNIISGDENTGGHAFWAPDTYSNRLSAGHNSNWDIVQDSAPLALNTWYHVAVAYDHATGAMVLYKNGTVVDSATVPVGDRNVTDTSITIGAFHQQVQFAWLGTIDDARIYPRALTAEQIAALYASGRDVVAPQETDDGDTWQCAVTPFTDADVGTTSLSNALDIGPCVPECAGKECGDDLCGGSCGACGLDEVCVANTCGLPLGPAVANVLLSSSSGNDLESDDLTCTYVLAGTATTAATAWFLDAAPLMRLFVPMEGGSAAALLDRSGNGLSVSAVGTPTWSANSGHDGHGAFQFDGAESLYAGENFPTESSYTKVAWVFRTGSGANGGNNIISGDVNGGGHAFWAPDLYSNHLSAGHNQNWNIVQDSVPLALNTWYQVAVTYDHATGAMVLYKNGAPVDADVVPSGDRPVTDATITIGAFHSFVEWAWQGYIDDARVYPFALSADQIAALYAGGDEIVAAETVNGDNWQCRVTGFSDGEAGPAVSSNIVVIGGGCEPDCTGKACGDDGCGGSCGTCGLAEYCAEGICVSGDPLVANVLLESTSGAGWNSDTLTCSYDLGGTATTAATAWSIDGTPQMVAYLPMEGGAAAALLDRSGSGHDGVVGGDPVWLPTGGHDGHGCFDFDGNDHIDLGNVLTGGSYSKVAWVRYVPGEAYNNIISGQTNHAFWVQNSGGAFRLTSGHNGNWATVSDPAAFPENTWVFVAVTYDGGNLRLYRNGAEIDSASGVPAITADTRAYIGSYSGTCCWHKGQIDDARVYNFALSADQIAALYAGGVGDGDTIAAAETQAGESWECQVTPFSADAAGTTGVSNSVTIIPTPDASVEAVALVSESGQNLEDDLLTCTYTLAGTAVTAATAWYLDGAPWMRLYLPMEGGAAGALLDRSGTGATITPGSDPEWLATGGFDGRGAFDFDGDDDFGAGEHFPTDASYTNAAWVYRTGSGANGGNNIVSGDANAGGHAFWAPDSYGNKLSAGHNAHWNTVQDSVALALNTWYHVALTYDRATGAMVLYKNGAIVDSAIVPAGDLTVTDATISVGSFGAANGYKWKGRLDDVRVYAAALSPEQIAALYAAGAGDRDTVVPEETSIGDAWQCRVTPFGADAEGTLGVSNTLIVVPPAECTTAGDCDDANLCTVDSCDAGTCSFSPVDCGSQFCRPLDGACVECLSTTLLDQNFDALT